MDGAADVACGVFEGLLEPQARKHLLQAFVLLARAPQIAFGVSTRAFAASARVADLKGRKIAVAAPGSSAQLVTALVLARAGLTLQDVHLVETGGVGTALQAVRSGGADAIAHTEPVITMLEQKGDIRIVSDTRSLKGSQDVFGGAMPSTCLFAPAQSVQNHANTMQALTNAVVHALKWLQTAGPSDLIKVVPESYLLGDRGLYLTSFSKIRESIALDGLIADDGAKTALRVLASLDPTLMPGKIDLGACLHQRLRTQGEGQVPRLARPAATAAVLSRAASLTGLCLLLRPLWRVDAVRTAEVAAGERAGRYTVTRWPGLSDADTGSLFHSATLLGSTL